MFTHQIFPCNFIVDNLNVAENSREIGLFFREFVREIPRNLTFFPSTYQKPWPPSPLEHGALGGAILIVTGYACLTVNLILAPVLSQS